MPDAPLNTLALLDLFDPLRTATAAEGAEAEDTSEQIVRKLDRLKICCEIVAEYKRNLTDSVVDWIDDHGEIELGGVRYYAAPKTTWTCTDPHAVAESILSEGSLEDLVACLASDPFKRTAAVAKCGAGAEVHFRKKLSPELREGKPRRVVHRSDEKWHR